MFPEKFVRNFSRLFHCSIIKVPTEKPLFSALCDVFKKLFSRSSAINTLSHLVVFVNTFFNFFFSRCFVRLMRTSYILPKISVFVNNFFRLFSIYYTFPFQTYNNHPHPLIPILSFPLNQTKIYPLLRSQPPGKDCTAKNKINTHTNSYSDNFPIQYKAKQCRK